MKLGVSHLAWDVQESEKIFNLLKSNNIHNVEGVITKINDWDKISEKDIIKYKKFLNSQKINISSLQSIFYNTNIKNLDDETSVIQHVKKLINYGKILSIKTLVFGSPSLRKIIKLPNKNISNIFKQIDNLLEDTGIQLSIEPNSKIYQGDFFYTISEIVKFIKDNRLLNIKTMIDTHNLILENQDPLDNLNNYFEYINHIHISENGLEPISNFKFHSKFAKKLHLSKYNNYIIYEVKKTLNIEKSIVDFAKIYK